MTQQITARKFREGKWWVFDIRELEQPASSGSGILKPVGQAPQLADVKEEARLLAGLWVDDDPDVFEVTVEVVDAQA
ncbi:hypothetical protein [Brevibacterium sp.]|uniref:hypothetical protein n=1 Tax=Brevibacterium sp. TaxID=1701 RepID=UPI002810CE37|nr:hypothetical protein [Brevibacterium sp.]